MFLLAEIKQLSDTFIVCVKFKGKHKDIDLKDEFYVKYIKPVKEERVRLHKETMSEKWQRERNDVFL